MKTKNAEVSVIIPCYNGEKFIGEAIESVLNQTYQNFEVIIIDDGSTDHSTFVIKRFLKDSRVKLVEHEQNKGIPFARNTGIKNACGQYIAFLDQDDFWLPNKLETQLGIFLEDPKSEIGLVFSDFLVLQPDKSSKRFNVSRMRGFPKRFQMASRASMQKALFLSNFIPTATICILRRLCFDRVGFFDESLKGGSDDYDLWLRIARFFKLAYVPIPLAVKRQHKGQYSSIQSFFRDDLVILEKAVREEPQLASLARRKLTNLYYRSGRYYQLIGDHQQARQYLWVAMLHAPLWLKPMLAWSLTYFDSIGRTVQNVWIAWRKMCIRR